MNFIGFFVFKTLDMLKWKFCNNSKDSCNGKLWVQADLCTVKDLQRRNAHPNLKSYENIYPPIAV
jgi:hypothetical protein